MGTGAVCVLLSALDPHPAWVTKIEIAFYIFNMCLFLLNVSMLALQFIRKLPSSTAESILTPWCQSFVVSSFV